MCDKTFPFPRLLWLFLVYFCISVQNAFLLAVVAQDGVSIPQTLLVYYPMMVHIRLGVPKTGSQADQSAVNFLMRHVSCPSGWSVSGLSVPG